MNDLRTALELRDASEDQTVDIIRQKRSQLIDTGEDPYDAIGDPSDYAKQYAPHSTTVRFWALIIGSVVFATSGGWLLANGIINLVGEKAILWGLDPLVGIIADGLLILIWIVALVIVGIRHAQQNRSRN